MIITYTSKKHGKIKKGDKTMEKKLYTVFSFDNRVRSMYHVSATEEEVRETVERLNKKSTFVTFRYVPLALTNLEKIEKEHLY